MRTPVAGSFPLVMTATIVMWLGGSKEREGEEGSDGEKQRTNELRGVGREKEDKKV